MKQFIAEVLNGNSKSNNRDPKQHQIKKHHWFLGSIVVLAGSWITHSTTATIYDGVAPDNNLSYSLMISDNNLTSDETQLIDSQHSIQSDAIESNLATSPNIVTKVVEDVPPVEHLIEFKHTVKKGETLGQIFKNLKLDLSLPHTISQHETAKQLVALSIGKELTFRTNKANELKEISYPNNALQELLVRIDNNQVEDVSIVDLPFQLLQHNVSGEISSSLYDAAIEAGLTINLVMEMVQIFGWDIDFAQDIRNGDSFHVIYDDYNFNDEKLADGNILAAEFTTQGNTYRAIRFEDDQGNVNYFTPEGKSMLGTFLRSPVEFSRISSRFGNRKHPILKTWRAHNGVDYAAATGTPIRATADGKVIHAGTKGGYGRTAILKHADRFTTLYAHMTGFAKGIRSGVSVKQGDIIGYVGSTGLATGPHLHYEFRVDGVHQNPLTYKTPKTSAIAAESMDEFKLLSEQWLAELGTITNSYKLAKLNSAKDTTQL